jgi:hypothetical protein
MRLRLIQVFAPLAVLAGVFEGAAGVLDRALVLGLR